MDTRTKTTPSAIARRVAGDEWPDVQAQYKLAPGVFGFSCAGHGGIVAIIGVADLPARNVQAARDLGMTELVVLTPYRGQRMLTTCGYGRNKGYTRDSLREYADGHGFETVEVWVGEEDCGWATIMHAATDAARASAATSGYFAADLDIGAEAYDSCRGWSEDYLLRVVGGYEVDPQGRYMQGQLEQTMLEQGRYLRRSALGLDESPETVHVLFVNKAGETVGRFMSRETYRAIPLTTTASVEDYEMFGEVLVAPADFYGEED